MNWGISTIARNPNAESKGNKDMFGIFFDSPFRLTWPMFIVAGVTPVKKWALQNKQVAWAVTRVGK